MDFFAFFKRNLVGFSFDVEEKKAEKLSNVHGKGFHVGVKERPIVPSLLNMLTTHQFVG